VETYVLVNGCASDSEVNQVMPLLDLFECGGLNLDVKFAKLTIRNNLTADRDLPRTADPLIKGVASLVYVQNEVGEPSVATIKAESSPGLRRWE